MGLRSATSRLDHLVLDNRGNFGWFIAALVVVCGACLLVAATLGGLGRVLAALLLPAAVAVGVIFGSRFQRHRR